MLSSWSGIRPLASDPTRTSTENIVRDHVVALEKGLLTITGGKWTTYRKVRQAAAGKHAVLWGSDSFFNPQMAEDAVNAAIAAAGLAPARYCHTDNLRLVGAGSYTPSSFVELLQASPCCLRGKPLGSELLRMAVLVAATSKRAYPALGRLAPEAWSWTSRWPNT